MKEEVGAETYAEGRFAEAIALFRDISLAPDFVEFLTIPGLSADRVVSRYRRATRYFLPRALIARSSFLSAPFRSPCASSASAAFARSDLSFASVDLGSLQRIADRGIVGTNVGRHAFLRELAGRCGPRAGRQRRSVDKLVNAPRMRVDLIDQRLHRRLG